MGSVDYPDVAGRNNGAPLLSHQPEETPNETSTVARNDRDRGCLAASRGIDNRKLQLVSTSSQRPQR